MAFGLPWRSRDGTSLILLVFLSIKGSCTRPDTSFLTVLRVVGLITVLPEGSVVAIRPFTGFYERISRRFPFGLPFFLWVLVS